MTNLPPLKVHGVHIGAIEDKRSELNENRRALRLAESVLTQLESQREQAKAEDVMAAVHAKRAGKKDPGPKAEKKLEDQIQQASREITVLKGLQDELESEAYDLMRENAGEIAQALGENLEALNTRQLEAITQLEATRGSRQALLRTMEMVGAYDPSFASEAAAEPGPGQDYFEVFAHHTTDSIMRINDQQLQKVIAQLRAEAGHREDLQAVVEQEQGTQDVFFPGTAGMPRPAGYERFMERKAERNGG
jgi:hypothetical protein